MPTADIDQALAALADPKRRAAIEILRAGPVRASDLATALSLTRPAMSRHLRVLRQAGLIDQELLEKDARVRMVQLRREQFANLRSWLDEVEVFWTDQLGAFKAHAERTYRGHRS